MSMIELKMHPDWIIPINLAHLTFYQYNNSEEKRSNKYVAIANAEWDMWEIGDWLGSVTL